MDTNDDKNLSREIFLYLCRVIGSEKIVHARRVFFQVHDGTLSNGKYSAIITSGSKGEGLNMSGSDMDFMFVTKPVLIFHDLSEIKPSKEWRWLITDTEHAPPGFVYLKVMVDPDSCYFATMSEYGPVVSNEKFKDIYLHSLQRVYGKKFCNKHGPCVSIQTETEEHDYAFCLRSHTWPKIAEEWFKRPRHFGWPPSSLEEMLNISGLLYVPIGSKFGVKENNPLQWRISFSIQEKLLVYSFNQTQLLCYALLKLILNEIINTQANISNLLCSYFMKTTVFWLSEEVEISEWRPERFLRCVKSCIKRLIYFVSIENCPNYFIPDNNMFEGKIYGKHQQDLLSVLENILTKDIYAILELPTLTHFIPGETYMHSNMEVNKVDVGLYPQLYKFTVFPKDPNVIEMPSLLTKLRKQSSNVYKSLYFLFLARYCMHILTIMSYNWQYNNKHFYQQYTLARFHALIGRNIDTVSGWLWFATFLYQHKQYHDALVVTSSILPECTPDKIYIKPPDQQSEIDFDLLSTKRFTFLNRHKLFCIHKMWMIPDCGSVFYNSDLNYSNNDPGIFAPPVVYLHFLRFLCFHHLGNISERNLCITDIELTIENEFFVSSCIELKVSNMYLLKALKIYHNCLNCL